MRNVYAVLSIATIRRFGDEDQSRSAMKEVLKKTLIERYKVPGWQQALVPYQYDPYLAAESYFEGLRKARIYVVNNASDEAPRLTRMFRIVWLSLPPSARNRIIKHWHENDRGYLPNDPGTLLRGVPTIKVSGEAKAIAETSYGHSFHFHENVLRNMPDQILQDIIAHELGHAWSYSFEDTICNEHHMNTHQAEIEWEADLAAEHWGKSGTIPFNMSRWRVWARYRPGLMIQSFGNTEEYVLPDRATLKVQPNDPATRV